METRVLRYFLAVAKEQSISKASEVLFVTQPTLSRQMMDLEFELGAPLFIRGSRGKKLILTEEGKLLQKRAEEILLLISQTENESRKTPETMTGDLYIGAAETPGFELIAHVISEMTRKYPQLRIHLYSANANDVLDRLEDGLLDFGLLVGNPPIGTSEFLQMPFQDQWGLLLSTDNPLSQESVISPEQARGLPLLISEQTGSSHAFAGWLGRDLESLDIVCRYNLMYNAAFLAASDTGAVLCLKGLTPGLLQDQVHFVPLDPPLFAPVRLVWKSSLSLSDAAKTFLEEVKSALLLASHTETAQEE